MGIRVRRFWRLKGTPVSSMEREERSALLANLHALEADLAKTTIARHPVWAARLRVWRDELRKQLEEVS